MLKVERLHPSEVPGRCMFYPSIIADDEGFYIGMNLDGLTPGEMRACISAKGAKEIARKEGMVDREEHERVLEQLAAANREVEDQNHYILELEEKEAHVVGLAKHGYQLRKQTGRPPKKKEAA